MKNLSFITGFAVATVMFAVLSFTKTQQAKNVVSLSTDPCHLYLEKLEMEISQREGREMDLLRSALQSMEENQDGHDPELAKEIIEHTNLRLYRMDHHRQLYEIKNTKAYTTGDRLPDSLMRALENQNQVVSIQTEGVESIIYFERSHFLENLKAYNSKN